MEYRANMCMYVLQLSHLILTTKCPHNLKQMLHDVCSNRGPLTLSIKIQAYYTYHKFVCTVFRDGNGAGAGRVLELCGAGPR